MISTYNDSATKSGGGNRSKTGSRTHTGKDGLTAVSQNNSAYNPRQHRNLTSDQQFYQGQQQANDQQQIVGVNWANQNYQVIPQQFSGPNFIQNQMRQAQSSQQSGKQRTRAKTGVAVTRHNQSQGGPRQTQPQQSHHQVYMELDLQNQAQSSQKDLQNAGAQQSQQSAAQYVAQRKQQQSKVKDFEQLSGAQKQLPMVQKGAQQAISKTQSSHKSSNQVPKQPASGGDGKLMSRSIEIKQGSEKAGGQNPPQHYVLENQIIKQTLEKQQYQNASAKKPGRHVSESQEIPGNASLSQYYQAQQSNSRQTTEPGEQLKGGNTKFNIVNVHNEFNIQNNIYIQQQPQTRNQADAANQRQQQRSGKPSEGGTGKQQPVVVSPVKRKKGSVKN